MASFPYCRIPNQGYDAIFEFICEHYTKKDLGSPGKAQVGILFDSVTH